MRGTELCGGSLEELSGARNPGVGLPCVPLRIRLRASSIYGRLTASSPSLRMRGGSSRRELPHRLPSAIDWSNSPTCSPTVARSSSVFHRGARQIGQDPPVRPTHLQATPALHCLPPVKPPNGGTLIRVPHCGGSVEEPLMLRYPTWGEETRCAVQKASSASKTIGGFGWPGARQSERVS